MIDAVKMTETENQQLLLDRLERELAIARAERDERQKALEVALDERTSALRERNWANARHDEARARVTELEESNVRRQVALEARVTELWTALTRLVESCTPHSCFYESRLVTTNREVGLARAVLAAKRAEAATAKPNDAARERIAELEHTWATVRRDESALHARLREHDEMAALLRSGEALREDFKLRWTLAEARVAELEALLETSHGCEEGRREFGCPVCAALASAPTPEPTPRDMRVAEAVREALIDAVCRDLSQLPQAIPLPTLRALDLAAVVAKAVGT